MQPEEISPNAFSESDLTAQFCALLQPLPSLLRYYDEFDDSTRSIHEPHQARLFEIHVYGSIRKIDFNKRNQHGALILKHVFAMMLEQDLSPASIAINFAMMHDFTDDDLDSLLRTGPLEIGLLWSSWRSREWQKSTYALVKHVLYLLCTYRWNGWSDDYRTYLSTTLPLPAQDKYAAVRSGDVFLSADEEALLVRHLDEIAANLKAEIDLPYSSIVDAGMLICAYQFAMRPVQIAMLDVRHVRIWQDGVDPDPTIHLTFHMAKQRGKESRIPLPRRVKREWACIFVHLQSALSGVDAKRPPKFFQARSSQEVGQRIAALVRSLIGTQDLGTATDLRHTAAQRLVDAGASHEELAEFLGHAQTNTGMIYYTTSASHAERVNELEMLRVLEQLLADDLPITARAVIRLHSTLKAASSITRNDTRSALLAKFQLRQEELRRWRSRTNKQSASNTAAVLETKVQEIFDLEATVQVLTASHIAMLRAVGEIGGFAKWAQFYESYAAVRNNLETLGKSETSPAQK